MENAANNSNGVELTLPGINKTWVRSNGEWRDKAEVEVKPVEMLVHDEDEGTSKKWWKFWKKG
ncbi:MAG: hypothetical protein HRT57_15155 [Crocinitomicaceae bacterium]|nr:hypothetical protein [Crocinitomicaceae bacterium]